MYNLILQWKKETKKLVHTLFVLTEKLYACLTCQINLLIPLS